jgi:hypothetical protein
VTEPTNGQESVALGTWIGREQAFNALAHHCSKARVACLKQIHDTEAYKNLNLTWDEFCPEHAGISRTHADRLISQFAEFGAPYFELTDIVPVSPAVYRQIEPVIVGGTIEFRGEQIPVIPENTVKIRAAIYALRKELEHVKSEALSRTPPDLTSLQTRLDACYADFDRLIGQSGQEQMPGLRSLVSCGIDKFNDFAKRL